MELAKTRKFLGIKFRQTFNLKQPHNFFFKEHRSKIQHSFDNIFYARCKGKSVVMLQLVLYNSDEIPT